MDQTLRCVLGFFLLILIPHGLAQGNRPRVTITPNWPKIFWGETITLRCEIGGDDEWTFDWNIQGSDQRTTKNENITSQADDREYSCLGRRGHPNTTFTPWSEPFKLPVTSRKPKAELRAEITSIPAGGAVTLTCNVNPSSSGWTYFWNREDKSINTQDYVYLSNGQISVSKGGVYRCGGRRGKPAYFTEYSDSVSINRILSNRAVVTLQPQWTELYSGEKITLRCEIEGGEDSEWEYEWETTSSDRYVRQSESFELSATVRSEGEYKCKGKHKTEVLTSTQWSTPLTLKVSAQKPKAELKADDTDIPVGGAVTLTCSVSLSSGWEYYFWYKADKSSKPSTIKDVPSTGQIRVSKEGLYRCRGERGNPAYETKDSDSVQLKGKTVANKAVVTLHPNWSEIYNNESITVRCDIKDGDDAEWEYEWKTTSSTKPSSEKEYRIGAAYELHSGNYSCKGRKKSDQSPTDWSDPIRLTVLNHPPRPVLTVSPLWLSAGDSVTLNCEVKHPSAGWRVSWYTCNATSKLSDNSYSYQLLSESEKSPFIVHGQTHTAAYVCRAGRGDPERYLPFSELKFVWSGDLHSPASLTVSPERAQHFIYDSVSLKCEGNSTQWRVRFQQDSHLRDCSGRGHMTGSTCRIHSYFSRNHVFWCESDLGEFSNAVNITREKSDIILMSPVHPVTEGSSVILNCTLRYNDPVSNVFFYRNGKLIQNDTRKQLHISAVSKSDEGFYKCQMSGEESSQSWMSVTALPRPEDSSFPVIPVIVGLICGVALVIFLLLLYCSCQSKDSCFRRPSQSESNNQDSARSHELYQNVAQPDIYASLQHGDASVYETLQISEDNNAGDDYVNQSVGL